MAFKLEFFSRRKVSTILATILTEKTMRRIDRIGGILAGISLTFIIFIFAFNWSTRSPATQVKAGSLDSQKPINGWYVCGNLGIGPVPGVPEPRQRLKLCHVSGWVAYTYCTQPGLPVPPMGRRCTRISDDTYRCGALYQRLREYRIVQTPVETNTPTTTPTPTASSTPTITASPTPTQTASPTPTLTASPTMYRWIASPTPTSGPRVNPGGEGNSTMLRALIVVETSVLIISAFMGVWIMRGLKKLR